MTIEVAWDNPEQTHIRYDFNGQWTWDDFQQAKTRADAMIDVAAHAKPVGVMFVISDPANVARNVIANTLSRLPTKHPRAVLLVLVSDNALVKTLWGTLVALYPNVKKVYRQADTVDAGRRLVSQHLAELEQQSNRQSG
jgi:hypothetical protein